MTQAQLAHASGVSARSISDYERGFTPKLDHLEKLSGALGVTIGWLIGESEQISAVGALREMPDEETMEHLWEKLRELNAVADRIKANSPSAKRGRPRTAIELAAADHEERFGPAGASSPG